jgi:hypothetical protein
MTAFHPKQSPSNEVSEIYLAGEHSISVSASRSRRRELVKSLL